MCMVCVPGAHRSQKKASDALELELRMVVRHNRDARSQTRVLWKNKGS